VVQALTSVYEKSGRLALDFFSEVTATDASDMIEDPQLQSSPTNTLQREDFFK